MTMYLIRKRGAYYRPNAEGYTCNRAEAGRYTLDEAIRHSHPNGANGPRDGIDYIPDTPASEFSASKHEPMSHRCETCGVKDGHEMECPENVAPDDADIAEPGRVAIVGHSQAISSAALIALLDDPRIADAIYVPGETADRLLYGSPEREYPGGLFARKPATGPIPPPTITRQQRRYLARKGPR